MLLGAFAAGVVWKLIMRDAEEADREEVESKVEAVAFGFLVPIFFIYTGITFDLEALLADPILLLALPLLLVVLLVIRGLPSMLAAPEGAGRRDRVASALFGATALPIIVAVTSIGVDEEHHHEWHGLGPRGGRDAVRPAVPAHRLADPTGARHSRRATRRRSRMTLDALLDAARARLQGLPRESLGEVVLPRRILGVSRAMRVEPRGTAWHLGVLLLTDDALLSTGRIVRARAEAPRGFTAESQRERAALAGAARRGGFAEGQTVHVGLGGAGSGCCRRGRGIRSAPSAGGGAERPLECFGRMGAARGVSRRAHRPARAAAGRRGLTTSRTREGLSSPGVGAHPVRRVRS